MESHVKFLLKFTLLLHTLDTVVHARSQISLEYKPIRPSYNPNPGSNTAHTVPPGKPWPASPEDYNSFSQTTSVRPTNRPPVLQDKFQEVTQTNAPTCEPDVPPQSGFEYEPAPPGFYPRPEQFIFPDALWFIYSSNAFGVNPPDHNFDNGPQGTTTTDRPIKPQIILEYQPNRPFYRPNPTDLVGQVVPPGQPWPANSEDYATFSQTKRPKPVSTGPQSRPTSENRVEITNATPQPQKRPKPVVVLEYQPNRPSFQPNPVDLVGQVAAPGKPWPANADDYNTNRPRPGISSIQNQQTLENRFDDTTMNKPVRPKPQIVLDYKPNRPFYRPNPTDLVGQVVPPGKPWPANPGDYISFGQTTSPKPAPTLDSRLPESTTVNSQGNQKPAVLEYYPTNINQGDAVGQIVRPGTPWPAEPSASQVNKTQILEYYPGGLNQGTTVGNIIPPGKPWPAEPRPSVQGNKNKTILEYYPVGLNQGNVIGQIVPPGKPWPANPEDYSSFSQTTSVIPALRNLTQSNQDDVTNPNGSPAESSIKSNVTNPEIFENQTSSSIPTDPPTSAKTSSAVVPLLLKLETVGTQLDAGDDTKPESKAETTGSVDKALEKLRPVTVKSDEDTITVKENKNEATPSMLYTSKLFAKKVVTSTPLPLLADRASSSSV